MLWKCTDVKSQEKKLVDNENDVSDDSDIENITFAPDDFEPFILALK